MPLLTTVDCVWFIKKRLLVCPFKIQPQTDGKETNWNNITVLLFISVYIKDKWSFESIVVNQVMLALPLTFPLLDYHLQ